MSWPADVIAQPFAPTSIWNMPLGSDAVYVPLRMSAPAQGHGVDEVYLPLSLAAPFRELVERDSWWPWEHGSQTPGERTGVIVRVPDDWVLPPPGRLDLPNRSAGAFQADGRVREFQYVVRPQAGSDVSFHGHLRSALSLDGDGLTSHAEFGGHGGSGMTCLGGTIRAGELTDSEPIRHALALTMNMRKWGTRSGGGIVDGFRWPAVAADEEFSQTRPATGYGTLGHVGGAARDGVGMGSLLAIPAEVRLDALRLETQIGAKLAWTHQNYGAYVVDNSGDDGSYDVHRLNVEERALPELGFSEGDATKGTPLTRDLDRIFGVLAVVENNAPDRIGGGGTPRQPLRPRLASNP